MSGCRERASVPAESGSLEWNTVTGAPTGTRYSPATIIARSNVGQLRRVWLQRTGDWPRQAAESATPTRTNVRASTAAVVSYRFEVTAVMRRRTLFVSTPFNRVLALDPTNGEIRWSFDPVIARHESNPEGLVSRGVAVWNDSLAQRTAPCATRVFIATLDARMLALDGADGRRCADFGRDGEIDLTLGAGLRGANAVRSNFAVTSPPAVANDLVIVGSAIRETTGVGAASGAIRAYDARRGTLRWTFDPIPRSPTARAWKRWKGDQATTAIGGNAWSLMTVDSERGLVFLPTASAVPDFYGGKRIGRNDYANSVVALRIQTGEVVWSFQVVHHDLWDYDVAAPPILGELSRKGGRMSVVIVGTKSGMVFVLNRDTGEPAIPVEERSVPRSDVQGEIAWPTQPFPISPPPLLGTRLTPDSMFGVTDGERAFCRAAAESLRSDGIFTPPSLRGTLQWPGPWGGINWDGMAWDPGRQRLIITLKRVAMVVRLDRQATTTARFPALHIGEELPQVGSPFVATRAPLIGPSGAPCSPPPWSELIAINFDSDNAHVAWHRPLGVVPWLAKYPQHRAWGSLSFGGPLVTSSGLVFIAGSQDGRIRALDVDNGAQLWEHELPAGGQASPMSYVLDGRQYVVVAAGGRSGIGAPGDFIVAFSLP